jgi:hypothetical protein
MHSRVASIERARGKRTQSFVSFVFRWVGGGRFENPGRPPLKTAAPLLCAFNQEKHYATASIGRDFMAKNPDDKPPLSLVNLTATLPKPPAKLGPTGAAFWRSLMAEYIIEDGASLILLEQAAFAYERAERLRVEIDATGEIIRGRNGPREHPGLRAELAARAFVVKTLAKLGLHFEPTRPSSGRPSGRAWEGRYADE